MTWNDLEEWTGSRIAERGRRYQQQGRVTDLAVTDDSALLGWVHPFLNYDIATQP